MNFVCSTTRPVYADWSLAEASDRIRAAWSIETTYTPELYSDVNPARGQCAVSAVAINFLFPAAVLMRGWVTEFGHEQVRHYWAALDGSAIDITWGQFSAGAVLTDAEAATFMQIVADPWMAERVNTLARNILRNVGADATSLSASGQPQSLD